MHFGKACLDHRQIDVLTVQKNDGEEPLIAVDSIDFYRYAFAFDQLLEKGLGFWTIGLTRELGTFRGLWGVDAKHSDAQFGLVGGDDGDGVAVGDMGNDAFFDTGFLEGGGRARVRDRQLGRFSHSAT